MSNRKIVGTLFNIDNLEKYFCFKGETKVSKTGDQWIGPSAYAKHRGVNLSTVKDWIKEGKLEGCIKNGSNNRTKINMALADKLMDGGNEEQESTGSDKDHAPMSSLTKARTAKTALEAKSAQLKYEQLAGNLVNRLEVEAAAETLGMKIKESLLVLPDRLAPILASESDIDEINYILTKAIDEALRELGSRKFSEELEDVG